MAETDIKQVLAAWNETDPKVRLAILEQTTVPDVIDHDTHKTVPSHGHADVDAFLTFFHERASGVTMSADGAVERVGASARFRFTVSRGAVLGRGTYFALLDANGLITQLYGYMDEEPKQ